MTRAGGHVAALARLLQRFGIEPIRVAAGQAIPGSYWGESEAGLVGNRLYFRDDTPLHSVLHEASHFICMSRERRARLNTDAGGDHAEENAVCYLQILLAGEFAGMDARQMCRDMDAWGYTFRLGSAQAWFEHDAADARQWLLGYRIIEPDGSVTGCAREALQLT